MFQGMAHEIDEGIDGLFSICVFKAEACSDDEVCTFGGREDYFIRGNCFFGPTTNITNKVAYAV
jgi:hypothetical protein